QGIESAEVHDARHRRAVDDRHVLRRSAVDQKNRREAAGGSLQDRLADTSTAKSEPRQIDDIGQRIGSGG
ncbi:MAG: hypothetical protein ACK56I_26430, partial [bacterium]